MALNKLNPSGVIEFAHEYTKLAIEHGLIIKGASIEDTAENVARFFNTLVHDTDKND